MYKYSDFFISGFISAFDLTATYLRDKLPGYESDQKMEWVVSPAYVPVNNLAVRREKRWQGKQKKKRQSGL